MNPPILCEYQGYPGINLGKRMGIMVPPGYQYMKCMDIIYNIGDTVSITSSFNTSNKI